MIGGDAWAYGVPAPPPACWGSIVTLEEIERSRPDTMSVVEAGQRLGLSREARIQGREERQNPDDQS